MSRNCLVTLNPGHSGDINDRRVVILTGVNDLLGFSSGVANIQKGGVMADLAVTLLDATARTVEINLGTLATDWLPSRPELGKWVGQIEVTFVDGTVLTWPARSGSQGIFEIEVLRELQ